MQDAHLLCSLEYCKEASANTWLHIAYELQEMFKL